MVRYLKVRYLFWTFLFWHFSCSYAQDPNFHIYLCFGQSNMEGAGAIENQDRTGVDARFQVMGAVNCSQNGKSYVMGRWQAATPSIVRCNTGLGPSDYFGRTMVANLPSNTKIGIVPVAVGGCDIALFDKVNYGSYVATAPSWMQGTINMYGGNPYARMVEVAKLAQKDGMIKGILLHQGETNNGQQTWPSKVKAIYDNLIKDLGLDASKTPLLVGELVTTAQGGACGLHNSVIAKVPSTIPNAHVISASGLAHNGDGLHFTSAAYRILGQRYAEKMLALYPKGTPPSVSLTAPISNSIFTTLQSITLTASASDVDGNVAKVDFYDGSSLIGSDITAPYSYVWTGMGAGTHTLSAKALDNSGMVASSTTVIITVEGIQVPLKGTPWQVPGKIEAEDYDMGGEGLAFHEADASGNQGGAILRNDQVDIETNTDAGGGHHIAYILNGEWLEYTIDVANTGIYDLDLRVAAEGTGKALHIDLDGVALTGSVNLPNTGGWQVWQTLPLTNLQLNKGVHVMRITFDANYMNLNYFDFKPTVITKLDSEESSWVGASPNPFLETLQVQAKGSFSYQLLSTTGNVLHAGSGFDEAFISPQLTSGLYLLKVTQGHKTYLHKLIKE